MKIPNYRKDFCEAMARELHIEPGEIRNALENADFAVAPRECGELCVTLNLVLRDAMPREHAESINAFYCQLGNNFRTHNHESMKGRREE